MKKVVLAVAFLFLAAGVYAQDKTPGKDVGAATATKVPPAQTVDPTQPSPKWLSEYDQFMSLLNVINELKAENGIDKLEAKLNEKGRVLQAQIPPGFTIDPQTRKFVKTPTPEPPKTESKK